MPPPTGLPAAVSLVLLVVCWPNSIPFAMSMEMELLLEELTDPSASGMDWNKVLRFVQMVKRDKDTG